jgi:hypothetical protein
MLSALNIRQVCAFNPSAARLCSGKSLKVSGLLISDIGGLKTVTQKHHSFNNNVFYPFLSYIL